MQKTNRQTNNPKTDRQMQRATKYAERERERQICSKADRQTDRAVKQTDMPQNATSKFATTERRHTLKKYKRV